MYIYTYIYIHIHIYIYMYIHIYIYIHTCNTILKRWVQYPGLAMNISEVGAACGRFPWPARLPCLGEDSGKDVASLFGDRG